MSNEYRTKHWLKNEWALNHILRRKSGVILEGTMKSLISIDFFIIFETIFTTTYMPY